MSDTVFSILALVLGIIVGIIAVLVFNYLKFTFLNYQVNAYSIALIHTVFNFISIIIFYPFLNLFEKFINKII